MDSNGVDLIIRKLQFVRRLALVLTTIVSFDAVAEEFGWPVSEPVVTQVYGCRGCISPSLLSPNSSYLTGVNIHTGVDLSSSQWDSNDPYTIPVVAAAVGIVRQIIPYTTSNRGLGNVVVIEHPSDGLYSLYAHLDSINESLEVGMAVPRGHPIGFMGHSSDVRRSGEFGVHLHFEIKRFGTLGNRSNEPGVGYVGYVPGHPDLYGYFDPRYEIENVLIQSTDPVVLQNEPSIDELNINVRPFPHDQAPTTVTDRIAPNQRVVSSKVASYAGEDWYFVDLPSRNMPPISNPGNNGPHGGWVSGSAAAIDFASEHRMVVETYNVRDVPGTEASTVIARVYSGQRFAFVGSNQDDPDANPECPSLVWSQIYLPATNDASSSGTTGWVCSDAFSDAGVDDTAPTIGIADPLSGGAFSASVVLLHGSAEDQGSVRSGVSSVELRVNGSGWRAVPVLDGRWSASIDLSAGTNTIEARSRDNAGNVSEIISVIGLLPEADATQLSVTLLASPSQLAPGGELFQQVSVRNLSDSIQLPSVQVELRVPDHSLPFPDAEIVGGAICPDTQCEPGEYARWEISLEPGQSMLLEMSSTISASSALPDGTLIPLAVVVNSAQAPGASAAGSVVISSNTATDLSDDGIVSGSIAQVGQVNEFAFSATAGESAHIRVVDTSGSNFSPEVYLYNPDGSLERYSSDGLTVELDCYPTSASCRLDQTGTYRLLVGDRYGDHIGTYEIHFVRVAQSNENGALVNDGIVSGDLTVGDIDSFVFSATAGESAHIRVVDTSGSNFSPEVYLYNPDGSLERYSSDGLTVELDCYPTSASCRLDQTGTYRLIVGDRYGDHAGTYEISLTGLSSTAIDSDQDGVADGQDNCPSTPNSDQANFDGDTQGDQCDADDDNDGLSDVEEAQFGTNPLARDSDGDGLGDGEEVRLGLDPLDGSDCPEELCPSRRSVLLRLLPLLQASVSEPETIDFVWPVAPSNMSRGHDGPCGDWPGDTTGCFWLSDQSEEASTIWRDVQPYQRHFNEAFGQYHLGADYNLGGGADDAGRNVFPAAAGVINSGGVLENVCGWGNIVFVEHATPEGPVTTMYAHVDWLESGPPEPGPVDSRSPIAVVGNGQWDCPTGSGAYPYHLHFEVRQGRSVVPGNGYSVEQLGPQGIGPQGQVDPNAFVNSN